MRPILIIFNIIKMSTCLRLLLLVLAVVISSVSGQSDQSMSAAYCSPSVLASMKQDPSFFSLAYSVIKGDRSTVRP